MEIDTAASFTEEELEAAVKKIRVNKAPGIDMIPPEVIKILSNENPKYILAVMNKVIQHGIFPVEWKKSRLILIRKPGKPESEYSSLRPISLISTASKLLEQLIAIKINQTLENGLNLSEKQYGFRKGRSTIQAIQHVHNLAMAEKSKTLKTRGLCVLITLDVRNAFNTVSWDYILKEIKRKDMPAYIINILNSYFAERVMRIEEGVEIPITSGVLQGSVLGPVL